MNVNKLLSLLLLPLLAACTDTYQVVGTSAIHSLNGKKLYLKSLQDGEWVKLDSAEVVHGEFAMKGRLDSVQMIALYMEEESVMPLVLERGKIELALSDEEVKAAGTPLNDSLYGFIARKNEMEERIGELGRQETQRVLNGEDLDVVRQQLQAEGELLVGEMNRYVKTFIAENYENVLGPGVFMMLCSALPYPVMTPQIDEIIKDAPYSFKNHKQVREFLSKAKENMQLIEEQRRMQQAAPAR